MVEFAHCQGVWAAESWGGLSQHLESIAPVLQAWMAVGPVGPSVFAVLAGSRLLWLPALFSWTRGGWRAGQEHIASLHWLVCFVDVAALNWLKDTTSQSVVSSFFLRWSVGRTLHEAPTCAFPFRLKWVALPRYLSCPLLPSKFLGWVNLRIIWCFHCPCDLISVSDLMTSDDVWHRQFHQQLHFGKNDETCLGGRMGLWTYQLDCLLKQRFLPAFFWLVSSALLLWKTWSQAAFWTSLRSPLPVTLRVAWPMGLSHGVLSMTCPSKKNHCTAFECFLSFAPLFNFSVLQSVRFWSFRIL